MVDLWRGRLSVRKTLVLIEQLPAGANLWQAQQSNAGWSTEAHLLAAVIDQLRVLAWQNTEDGQKNRSRPEPVERPETEAEQQAESERVLAQAKAWKDRQLQKAKMRAQVAARGRS